MKTVYGYQWSEYDSLVNFGDMLTEVILAAMGIQYRPVSEAPEGFPTLLAVGTILDRARIEIMTQKSNPVYVWGSGYRTNPVFLRHSPKIHWHAVRGPLTRDILWLPRDIPLGDPALVLPQMYDRVPNGKIICVPHWQSVFRAKADLSVMVSPLVKRDAVLDTVMTIAGADFVLAGSLHAAIIAHAYGVPWAFWGMCSDNDKVKWQDWTAYLGLGIIDQCNSVAAGTEWWDAVGCHIPRTNSTLLEVFPEQCVLVN